MRFRPAAVAPFSCRMRATMIDDATQFASCLVTRVDALVARRCTSSGRHPSACDSGALAPSGIVTPLTSASDRQAPSHGQLPKWSSQSVRWPPPPARRLTMRAAGAPQDVAGAGQDAQSEGCGLMGCAGGGGGDVPAVVEGRNLAAKDSNGLADPYVLVRRS